MGYKKALTVIFISGGGSIPLGCSFRHLLFMKKINASKKEAAAICTHTPSAGGPGVPFAARFKLY
jgi:hypothetical protein